ncbi:MAG TPA: glycosyltransferase family 4 protein [Dissulfurispiraceae bacterium]
MRILYIWDADYPWDVRVEKICRTLAENGAAVHIASRNLKRRPEYEQSGGLHIHRLAPRRIDFANRVLSFPAFFSPVWRGFLDRIISRENIDLVIVRDLPLAAAGVQAGERRRVPVIFDMAEDYVAMLRDIWKTGKFKGANFAVRNPHLSKIVERYVFRRVDHVLVVIEEAAEVVIRGGGRPGDISVVGNTPPLDSFRNFPDAGPDAGPAEGVDKDGRLGLIRERYSAIYTGGIQMGRGIQTVLDALPEIVRAIPGFLFVVVGDGYAADRLRKEIRERRLQDHVLWAGWLDHRKMIDCIRSCRVGLIPHLVGEHVKTTIPNKLFDYMGLGLPVVASDAPPMKRILHEEQCGITFKSGNAQGLARAVIEISRSGSGYGENGARAVRQKYNWAEDGKRLLKAVETAAGDGVRC